ncbi:MAG: aspartate carbamoyltransferase [Acidimicrobiia bacterium]
MTPASFRAPWCRGTACVVLALVGIVAGSACQSSGSSDRGSRQAQVEARGASVMPFDQTATTHVFHATPSGGVQRVLVKDPGDTAQLRLVRRHLREEARRFAAGDFTDPMRIHGMRIPGITTLRRGAARMTITYAAVPRGARITYTTSDPGLVAALHEWFAAQLMDHGEHARP